MVRNIAVRLSILCAILLLQNCVHGELDDCPPMVRYAVAFEYTTHTGITDRFYDDVKKIHLFVFDEHGLVFIKDSVVGPFDANYSFSLDNLPMGKYHIIAWGNVLNDQPYTIPTDFVIGQTTIAEARLILEREAQNMSRTDLEKLFYGEKQIEIPLYVSRVDTVPLVNNTKWLRVVVHWDHTADNTVPFDEVINYDEVRMRLEASNAEYNFYNRFTQTNNVVYTPYAFHYESSILDRDARDDEIQVFYYQPNAGRTVTNTCVYEFALLRMTPDSPITLIIERKKQAITVPYVLATINIIEPFSTFFTTRDGLTVNMQASYDKHDFYRIDIYFDYDRLAGEYVTGSMHVLDWKEIEVPSFPGLER